VEIRIAEPIWHTDESGADASLVERLEAQVEALTRKVGRLERRQQRFAEMIRLLLELHDQTTARLNSLGVPREEEREEALSVAVGEFSRIMTPAASTTTGRSRRPASRRKDA
jgi:hypothetical protein